MLHYYYYYLCIFIIIACASLVVVVLLSFHQSRRLAPFHLSLSLQLYVLFAPDQFHSFDLYTLTHRNDTLRHLTTKSLKQLSLTTLINQPIWPPYKTTGACGRRKTRNLRLSADQAVNGSENII